MIPEGDVYRLIIRSNLPEAGKFKDWVLNEVLPSIRKSERILKIKELKNNKTQTMKAISSREIAKATGKNHGDVMRDIREMCEQAGVTILLLTSKQICFEFDTQEVMVFENEYEIDLGHAKRKAKEYLLNEMAAEVLALGYDVKRRIAVLKLIRKMREALEKQLVHPDFKDPIAAARGWADAMEQKQLAEGQLELSKEVIQKQRQPRLLTRKVK